MIHNTFRVFAYDPNLPPAEIEVRTEYGALQIARELAPTYKRVSVTCETMYSDDDTTPRASRTYFHVCFRSHDYGLSTDQGGDFDSL